MTREEAKAYLKQNQVRFILAQFVDIHGVAKTKSVPVEDPHYARVLKAIKKQDKRALPHTLEKLQKHVANMVKGKGVDEHVPKLVKRLFKDGLVKEEGEGLAYPEHGG